MWKPQLDRLADEFRCVALDLPGHGTNRAARFGLDRSVEFVREVIDDEAGGAATVVGLSLGAYVGIATAASHPARVQGLVSSGAGVEFQGVTAWVNRVQGRLFPLAGPFLARFALKQLGKLAPAGTQEAMEEAGGLSMQGAGDALRDLAGRDFRSLLVQYDGPVLALMGVRDKHNVSALPTMIEGMTNVATEIIQDGGHSCSLSQPDKFSDAVRRFGRERALR
jgi:pimeloyl-ACP methyl ester carboxylesterase